MRYLSAFGLVVGVDLSELALSFCRQRGLVRLSQSTVASLPFEDRLFDLVVSFDVLYHRAVRDYHQALAEFHRVLRAGGRLFLRLPAYNWLRGRHDVAIHTSRRFTTSELRQALTTAGFVVEKSSYANTLLFPTALGKRLLERVVPQKHASDVHPNPPWQDAFLARFLFAEARWLARYSLPFGLSVVVIGRKE
jgi:SAM-dependent methyltransferase